VEIETDRKDAGTKTTRTNRSQETAKREQQLTRNNRETTRT
jgi:hypothetical protein